MTTPPALLKMDAKMPLMVWIEEETRMDKYRQYFNLWFIGLMALFVAGCGGGGGAGGCGGSAGGELGVVEDSGGGGVSSTGLRSGFCW